MNKKNKNNLVFASVIMLIFTIISKISGFVRELVFANFYGASNITDAYITATTISTTIFAGITVAVATSYIPSVSAIKKENVSKITSNIINIVMIIVLFLSVLGTIFIDQLIPIFAVGFSEENRIIAANMAKIILPFSFLYTISNILSGYLQLNNTFWTIGVSTVINNSINMVVFAISGGNLNILAIGFVLSWLMPVIFFMILAMKKGFKYKFTLDIRESTFKNIILLGIPIFFGQFVFQLNTLVDRNFASTLGEGTLTSLKYANQLNLFVVTIFVISITTAIFPTISKLASEKNFVEFKQISYKTTSIVLLFVVPITAAFVILAKPIVELVFMRGQFDSNAAQVTSNALIAYAFAIPSISMNEILNKQFYAIKDTKTPVFCSVISLLTNIILNFITVKFLGYVGLCISTAIANSVLALILYARLRSKIGNLGSRKLVKNAIKMLFSAIIMGVVVKFTVNIITPYIGSFGSLSNILILAVSGIIGVIVYFMLVYLLKVDELSVAIDFLRKKIIKKQ